MAFSAIVQILYVIDILNYTAIDNSWGIRDANLIKKYNLRIFISRLGLRNNHCFDNLSGISTHYKHA